MSLEQVLLPDQRIWWSPNRSDTLSIWREIFEGQCYANALGVLRAGDVVIDVGAHTGLASAYFSTVQGVTVHAFEPAESLYRCLALNTAELAVAPRRLAMSNFEGPLRFVYYPNVPCISGVYADPVQDNATSIEYLVNQGMSREEAGEYCSGMHEFAVETVEATTLSRVMEDLSLERVDLLKIDVEKAELDVLEGISGQHWERISFIALEVHDLDERVDRTASLLKKKGYDFEVTQERHLQNSGIFSFWASRR